MASALDTIWVGVVYNVGGFDLTDAPSLPPTSTLTEIARSDVDELFYPIIYVVVVS